MFQIKLLFFFSCLFVLNDASFFHHSKQHRRDITFHHKFDSECAPGENLNSNCTLYIFIYETSPQSCQQEKTFFQVATSILNQLPDGNSYGNRYFAEMSKPGSDWCEFEYNNKLQTIQNANESVVSQYCKHHENATYYTEALNYLLKTSSRFANVAVFLHGETDIIVDIAGSLKVAQQIAAKSNMIAYVWDHSKKPDKTGLFATLTGKKTGHIIRSSTNVSQLLGKVQKQLIPDFINIGCGGSNTPSTTPMPPGCSLLIFVEESSNAIGFDSKLMFLRLVQQIASAASNGNANQRFAITFFATEIYYPIIPQSFMDFNASINKYIDDINFGNFPNGNKIFLQPILNYLNTVVRSNLYANYAVLIMGEMQSVLDSGKAYTLAKSIAASGADVYVLDESRGISSTSFWSALTNGLNGHIVNGTGASMDSLFQIFNNNLIPEFKSMQC